MTSSISYTRLTRDQASQISAVDRTESVDGLYRVVDGSLRLEAAALEVGPWDERESHEYVTRLSQSIDSGGVAFGAWSASELLAFGSLAASPVGGDSNVLKLDMLYVGSRYRGRGIGRRLISLLSEEARSRSATALYVSATPSRATVEAYLRLGAVLLPSPDPELFEREPEDVHLIIELG
jgi:GNAT superfamily N-acetyltransferase